MNRLLSALLFATLLVPGSAWATERGGDHRNRTRLPSNIRQTRGPRARFGAVAPADRVARTTLQQRGFRSQASGGATNYAMTFRPARGRQQGHAVIQIDEHYRGTAFHAHEQDRIFHVEDVHGQTHTVPARLIVQRGPLHTAYSRARLEIAVPAGVSENGLRDMLRREGFRAQ